MVLGVAGAVVAGVMSLRSLDEPEDPTALAQARFTAITDRLAILDAGEQRGEVDLAAQEKIIEDLRDLTEQYPSFAPAQRTLARLDAYALQERVTQAMDKRVSLAIFLPEAESLVQRAPDLVEARVLLGQVLLSAKQNPRALAQFDAAVSLRPGDAELRSLLGTLLLDAGQAEAAVDAYRAAVDLSAMGQIERHRVFLGNALLKAGRLDEAERAYRAVLERDGSSHRAYAGLADLLAQRGDTAGALAMLDDAELWADQDDKADPLDYRLRRWTLLREAGRSREALQEVMALPKELRVTRAVSDAFARLADDTGAPMLAAAQYAQLVERFPNDADALADAAHWHLEAGDTQAASGFLLRLKVTAPQHPRLTQLTQRVSSRPAATPPAPTTRPAA